MPLRLKLVWPEAAGIEVFACFDLISSQLEMCRNRQQGTRAGTDQRLYIISDRTVSSQERTCICNLPGGSLNYTYEWSDIHFLAFSISAISHMNSAYQITLSSVCILQNCCAFKQLVALHLSQIHISTRNAAHDQSLFSALTAHVTLFYCSKMQWATTRLYA